jgi:hypothetical protein
MSKQKKEERKVKSIQKYTFEIIHYEDGYSTMNRNNDGFSVIELLGVVSIVQNNLMGLFERAVKPNDEVNINSTNSPLIHKPSE